MRSSFFGDATRESGLNDDREWALVIVGKPENCFEEVFWQGAIVDCAMDILCIKIWFCCSFDNNSDGVLFADGYLDDVAFF